MIRFSVARVEKEPVELVGDEPAEWLEVEPSELLSVTAPVHYDLLAKAVSGGVLVEGKVRTDVAGLCGRCLEPVAKKIENSGVCLFYEQPEEDELDITEEKVRLASHCRYFTETAEREEAPGRKLGFIAQEMGREINTMGSKANDHDIQKLVVRMKDELEKIKEQCLNVL